MNEPNNGRIIVLIPSGQDLIDPAFRNTYWPNFVQQVRWALRDAKIDCRVVVGGQEQP